MAIFNNPISLREETQVKIKSNMEKYQKHEIDTGSPEVQISAMSARIERLGAHMINNKKDVHSRRGLDMLIHKRRKMMDYLKKRDPEMYKTIKADLKIRTPNRNKFGQLVGF